MRRGKNHNDNRRYTDVKPTIRRIFDKPLSQTESGLSIRAFRADDKNYFVIFVKSADADFLYHIKISSHFSLGADIVHDEVAPFAPIPKNPLVPPDAEQLFTVVVVQI